MGLRKVFGYLYRDKYIPRILDIALLFLTKKSDSAIYLGNNNGSMYNNSH